MITYKTFLMKGTGSGTLTYEKLVDIKDYPDIGSEPERLERTTLSDPMRVYENGIQDSGSMSFTANYDPEKYAELKDMEGTLQHLAIWFGGTESAGTVTATGDEGKWNFDGYVSVFVTGKGVNEVREMSVSVTASTTPTFVTT